MPGSTTLPSCRLPVRPETGERHSESGSLWQAPSISAYTDDKTKGKDKFMRRVAITGIGAISPNGIGRERFWKATREGVSGVRRITRFDPSGFVVQVAGEIPDEFDETAYVDVKDRPHVSRAAGPSHPRMPFHRTRREFRPQPARRIPMGRSE